MAVLTISREIGTRGPRIGRDVAARMGYCYADKHTMDQVFQTYGFIPFDRIYDEPTSFWDRFDNMRNLTLDNLDTVIKAMAHEGNVVIVGRGSFAVLGGLDDVLNVRLQAPFEQRLKVFMEMEGIDSIRQAEEMLEESDSIRSGFVESTYNIPWDAASNFDLVISLDKISPKNAVDWLCQTLTEMDARNTRDLPMTARLFSVEPFMETAVRSALSASRVREGESPE